MGSSGNAEYMGEFSRMIVVLLVSSILSLCAGSPCVAEIDGADLMPWDIGYTWFRIWNSKSGKELREDDDNTVSMLEITNTNGKWKWATNSCNPELKYLVSRASGFLLAADGKTLTAELEGNAWTYDSTLGRRTLQSESGGYLSDRRKKGQTVRALGMTSYGMPWLWFRWRLANGYD